MGRAAAETSEAANKMLHASTQDGATVDVHVNLKNPSEATLNPYGDGGMAYVPGAIAGIFAALAYS